MITSIATIILIIIYTLLSLYIVIENESDGFTKIVSFLIFGSTVAVLIKYLVK